MVLQYSSLPFDPSKEKKEEAISSSPRGCKLKHSPLETKGYGMLLDGCWSFVAHASHIGTQKVGEQVTEVFKIIHMGNTFRSRPADRHLNGIVGIKIDSLCAYM